MDDHTAIKEILRHLSDGRSHSIYSLHQHFRLSPARLVICFEYLVGLGVIDLKKRYVRLKQINDPSVFAKLRLHFLHGGCVIEKNNEARYHEPRIGIDDLYWPSPRTRKLQRGEE